MGMKITCDAVGCTREYEIKNDELHGLNSPPPGWATLVIQPEDEDAERVAAALTSPKLPVLQPGQPIDMGELVEGMRRATLSYIDMPPRFARRAMICKAHRLPKLKEEK